MAFPLNAAPYMIDMTRSTFGALVDFPLAASAAFTQDGLVAKRVVAADGMSSAIQPYNGSGEILGICIVEKPTVFRLPIINEVVTIGNPVSTVLTLSHANIISGSLYLVNTSNSNAVLAATTDYVVDSLTNGTLHFVSNSSANEAGDIVYVSYAYSPTLQEILTVFGETFDTRTVDDIFNQLPVACGTCEIYTLNYDPAAVFTIGASPYVNSTTSIFQSGSSGGVQWTNANITKLPTAADSFLGVSYRSNV